jgi:hypothetical protein
MIRSTRWGRLAVRSAGWIAVLLPAADAVSRQLTRTHLLGLLPDAPLRLALIPAAGLALIAVSRIGGAGGRPRAALTAAVFAALLASGLALQLQFGARLQSDGFYYYAYLRSLAFDHDVNFVNDYRMLGMGDKAHLFRLTATGHAQSAWTIGPAIVWAPFFAAGHVAAVHLEAGGADVATDGTSYPYRQAVCIAGLVYALLGSWFTLRLCDGFFRRRRAAAAVAVTIGGSFMVWYALAEPTMTHAPSMAAVAGFAWAWSATHGRRRLRGWIALGALGGLMTLIRWQNALFALLPAAECLAALWQARRARDAAAGRRALVSGLAFTAAATVAFVPQMLAWKAIYGSYLAVSPIGPQIRWFDPHMADVLWSSRNGLFAMSPALYVAAVGLLAFAWRRRAIGVPIVIACLVMVYFNACIQDWWGSAGFGGRRFDGVVPLLVPGMAVALGAARRFVARRPQVVAAGLFGGLVVWNLTFMRAAADGTAPPGQALDFRAVSADQARTLHAWIGNPFTYPASLWFAVRNGVSPANYDLLEPLSFLGDPLQPYGRVDLGNRDDPFVQAGWSAPDHDGPVAFRRAGPLARLLIPLHHAAPLDVQIRLRAAAGAALSLMTIDTGRARFGPMPVPDAWQTVVLATPASAWRAGVNRVSLEFSPAPGSAGATGPAADVDYIRVQVRPGGSP